MSVPLGLVRMMCSMSRVTSIRKIEKNKDAVFIGHGAAFVLRNHPGVIRVFVHAPEPWRIAAAQRTYALELAAAGTIRRSDRRRACFIEGFIGVLAEGQAVCAIVQWTLPQLISASSSRGSRSSCRAASNVERPSPVLSPDERHGVRVDHGTAREFSRASQLLSWARPRPPSTSPSTWDTSRLPWMRAPRARRRSRYDRAAPSMLSTWSTLSSRGASFCSRASPHARSNRLRSPAVRRPLRLMR